VDNEKEKYYIQIILDGLFKVDEDIKDYVLENLSRCITEILQTDGIISSKSDLNIISEIEVLYSTYKDDIIN